jgi:hypothetical protein
VIDEFLAGHESRSTPVSHLGYQGLSACFPASLLDATRVVLVDSATRPVAFPRVIRAVIRSSRWGDGPTR